MYRGLKWAIGIITWSRPAVFKEFMDTLAACADVNSCDKIIVVEDASGNKEKYALLEEFKKRFPNAVVQFAEKNGGVSANSNRVLNVLKLYDFGFLLNDDYIKIKSPVFKKYMDAFLATGIHCFTQNVNVRGKVIEMNGVQLRVSGKSYGTWITTTKQMLRTVGGLDRRMGRFGFEHRLFVLKAKKKGFIGDPNTFTFYDIANSSAYLAINNASDESTQGTSRYTGFKDKWEQLRKDVYKPYFGDVIDTALDIVDPKDEVPVTPGKNVMSRGISDKTLADQINSLWSAEDVPLYFKGDKNTYFALSKKNKEMTALDLVSDNAHAEKVIAAHQEKFEKFDFSGLKGDKNRGVLFYAIALYWGKMFPRVIQDKMINYLKETSFNQSRYGWLAFLEIPLGSATRYFTELLADNPALYNTWVTKTVELLYPVKQLTDFLKNYNLPLRVTPTVMPIQKIKFMKILYSAKLKEMNPTLAENSVQRILNEAIKVSPFKTEDLFTQFLTDQMQKEEEADAKGDINGKEFKVNFLGLISSVKDGSVDADKIVTAATLDVMKAGVKMDIPLDEQLKFAKAAELVCTDGAGSFEKIKIVNGGANTTFKAEVGGTDFFFKIRHHSQTETGPISQSTADFFNRVGVGTPMVKQIKLSGGELNVKGVEVRNEKKQNQIFDAEMAEFLPSFIVCQDLAKPKAKGQDAAMAIIQKISGDDIKRLVVADFMSYQQDRFTDNVGIIKDSGKLIALDNDLAFGFMDRKPILSFMIRELALDPPKKYAKDERCYSWVERVFMPAFDYRTYGEVGVNYEPEIIGMLTEFSDNEDGMLDSFCPTGTRPNIKEAIRLNLRNMMDVGFEGAIMKYKSEIMNNVLKK
jgi:hypothetical protein